MTTVAISILHFNNLIRFFLLLDLSFWAVWPHTSVMLYCCVRLLLFLRVRSVCFYILLLLLFYFGAHCMLLYPISDVFYLYGVTLQYARFTGQSFSQVLLIDQWINNRSCGAQPFSSTTNCCDTGMANTSEMTVVEVSGGKYDCCASCVSMNGNCRRRVDDVKEFALELNQLCRQISVRDRARKLCTVDAVKTRLPILKWLPKYRCVIGYG